MLGALLAVTATLTFACAHDAAVGGKDAPAPKVAPAPDEGLDALLTGYDYPHPVHRLDLEAQRQRLQLAYMDVRPEEPNGRTVLLLHGKNFSGAYWADTIDALTQRGYRVVVPDQIGFGKSSKPERFQFTFQALATHTRALLDALEVERVSVVGHSMGGMLATRFALMFPERSERLVLVNPIGLEDWAQVVPYAPIEDLFAAELRRTPEAVRAYMRDSYFDGKWQDAYEPLVELQVGWLEGPDRERIAWLSALTADMIFTQPVVHDLERLRLPTLLIIGERDRTALGKDRVSDAVASTLGDYGRLGEQAAQAIPGARLVELEGVGHLPQFERFDDYAGALLDFLE